MRVLVLQHIAVEHPGVFRDFMTARNDSYDVVELDEQELILGGSTHDLLMVMGGPMDVWQKEQFPWLITEIAFIRSWVNAGKPFIGICLGHQLLAEAVGGSVGPMASPEVGIAHVALTAAGKTDTLFAGIAPTSECLQWHSSEVKVLPEGAVILASNAKCPVQAFRFGHGAYGVQYHVEVTPRTVAEWGAVPEYAASLEAALGKNGQAQLENDAAGLMPVFNATAVQIFNNITRIATNDSSLGVAAI